MFRLDAVKNNSLKKWKENEKTNECLIYTGNEKWANSWPVILAKVLLFMCYAAGRTTLSGRGMLLVLRRFSSSIMSFLWRWLSSRYLSSSSSSASRRRFSHSTWRTAWLRTERTIPLRIRATRHKRKMMKRPRPLVDECECCINTSRTNVTKMTTVSNISQPIRRKDRPKAAILMTVSKRNMANIARNITTKYWKRTEQLIVPVVQVTYTDAVQNIRDYVVGLQGHLATIFHPCFFQHSKYSKVHKQFCNHYHAIHYDKGYDKNLKGKCQLMKIVWMFLGYCLIPGIDENWVFSLVFLYYWYQAL